MCVCGHSRVYHEYQEGCTAFLCCKRTRFLQPGKRHTEHDFADHRGKSCLCEKFVSADDAPPF